MSPHMSPALTSSPTAESPRIRDSHTPSTAPSGSASNEPSRCATIDRNHGRSRRALALVEAGSARNGDSYERLRSSRKDAGHFPRAWQPDAARLAALDQRTQALVRRDAASARRPHDLGALGSAA